jgi:hypothetical protein
MTTLAGDEPDLQLGDSNEHVTQLQDRLRGLQLLDKTPDGTYDDATETAVRQLQSTLGLEADGRVTAQTWQALDQYMLDNGLQYNHYAGPGNQHWDTAADPYAAAADPYAAAADPYAAAAGAAAQPEPHWDGQQWLHYDADSQQWLPMQDESAAQAGAADAAGGAADEPPVVPHIDNIHPGIRDDERFSAFHDFLRETHG